MTRKTHTNKNQDPALPGLENASQPGESMAEPSSDHRIFYVTNASNLRSILASGLIRLRQGWPKYAPDFQELTPGYIPLFCDGVPHKEVVGQVTQHDRHDFPVIIEFEVKTWNFTETLCVLTDGKLEKVGFSKVPQGACMLLVRGVLPLADIRKVHFASTTDAKRFNSDCQALANTRAGLFTSNNDFTAVPGVSLVAVDRSALPVSATDDAIAGQIRRMDAVGGVLAALTRLPQAGGAPIIRDIFSEWPKVQQNNIKPTAFLPENIILTLERWIQAEKCQKDDTMCTVLCCTLDFLSIPQSTAGFAADALLNAIAKHSQTVPEKEQKLLQERLEAIRKSVLQDESPASLFQRQGSPVLRGLLLFLLDYVYREERSLPRGCNAEPQDLLIAEILRGAQNGWSRVPVAMRGEPQAELAVGYAMARLANDMPGAVRFEERPFIWVDDNEALAAILREIVNVLGNKASPKELKQLVSGERAQELDIRIKTKRIKGASGPVVERTLKKTGKKTTLTFVLSLPWN
jgi:hypothetical protein